MKLGKLGQGIMSPQLIMSVVVALIILAVGVYAFFTTQTMIPATAPTTSAPWTTTFQNSTYFAVQNNTNTGNQVFNILGIVLVIGAIMLIVAMVYNYVKPGA